MSDGFYNIIESFFSAIFAFGQTVFRQRQMTPSLSLSLDVDKFHMVRKWRDCYCPGRKRYGGVDFLQDTLRLSSFM